MPIFTEGRKHTPEGAFMNYFMNGALDSLIPTQITLDCLSSLACDIMYLCKKVI